MERHIQFNELWGLMERHVLFNELWGFNWRKISHFYLVHDALFSKCNPILNFVVPTRINGQKQTESNFVWGFAASCLCFTVFCIMSPRG